MLNTVSLVPLGTADQYRLRCQYLAQWSKQTGSLLPRGSCVGGWRLSPGCRWGVPSLSECRHQTLNPDKPGGDNKWSHISLLRLSPEWETGWFGKPRGWMAKDILPSKTQDQRVHLNGTHEQNIMLMTTVTGRTWESITSSANKMPVTMPLFCSECANCFESQAYLPSD